MIYEILKLQDHFPSSLVGYSSTLTVYSRENSPEIDPNRKYPTVLICPGGGYGMTSDREAEPVALAFLNRGYTAAVLRYSPSPARYPVQLTEVVAAMALLKRSSNWNIDTKKISVCGFSAGGHLAASLGTMWDDQAVCDDLKISAFESKPCAMVLSYPVITSGEHAHRGSFDNLLGTEPNSALLHKLSLENAVTPKTCPAFIWHTANDDAVPVQNAFLLASALQKSNVKYELHIFESGPHGMSLANVTSTNPAHTVMADGNIAVWFDLAVNWLDRI